MLPTNSESSLLPLSPVLSVYQLFDLSSNVVIITGGVTHFIINLRRPGLYDLEGVHLFAKEVMLAFRSTQR